MTGRTEPAKGGKQGKNDHIVVFAPQHPAAVDENEVTNEIGERDEEICGIESRGLCGIPIYAC